MTEPPQIEKLSRLRAKTDRQILDFIESKLNVALRFVTLAEAEFSQASRATAQQLLDHVARTLNEAQTLLLLLDERQRGHLKGKFNQVTEGVARYS